jgi:hypothetical protein
VNSTTRPQVRTGRPGDLWIAGYHGRDVRADAVLESRVEYRPALWLADEGHSLILTPPRRRWWSRSASPEPDTPQSWDIVVSVLGTSPCTVAVCLSPEAAARARDQLFALLRKHRDDNVVLRHDGVDGWSVDAVGAGTDAASSTNAPHPT